MSEHTWFCALISICIYMFICTLLVLCFGDSQDFLFFLATGIFGVIIWIIAQILNKMLKLFRKYKYRSIIIDMTSGAKYQCPTKYFNYFPDPHFNYRTYKRYASKDEWKDLPELSLDILEEIHKHFLEEELEEYFEPNSNE